MPEGGGGDDGEYVPMDAAGGGGGAGGASGHAAGGERTRVFHGMLAALPGAARRDRAHMADQ